jgi:hypothetical protein
MNLFGGVLTLEYDAAELALGAFALLALLALLVYEFSA